MLGYEACGYDNLKQNTAHRSCLSFPVHGEAPGRMKRRTDETRRKMVLLRHASGVQVVNAVQKKVPADVYMKVCLDVKRGRISMGQAAEAEAGAGVVGRG